MHWNADLQQCLSFKSLPNDQTFSFTIFTLLSIMASCPGYLIIDNNRCCYNTIIVKHCVELQLISSENIIPKALGVIRVGLLNVR